ncbi:protein of unknown function [Pararobbsia alpina]
MRGGPSCNMGCPGTPFEATGESAATRLSADTAPDDAASENAACESAAICIAVLGTLVEPCVSAANESVGTLRLHTAQSTHVFANFISNPRETVIGAGLLTRTMAQA